MFDNNLTVTFTNANVVNFVKRYNIDVEAFMCSILEHLDIDVDPFVRDFTADNHENDSKESCHPHGIPLNHSNGEPALNVIMQSVQRVMEESSQEISNQNVAAIGRLKMDISNELREFHTKGNENSSVKGARSEQRVMHTLVKNYPSIDITDSSKSIHSCDIKMTFSDNLIILVENKDYSSKNIPRKEVSKFIGDLTFQNSSGVLFSQSSGIANKHNFQLDIVSDTVVALYVSNVDHEPNIIIAAIDIIKNVTDMLRNYKNNQGNHIKISNTQLKALSIELNTYNEKITQVRQLVSKFEKDLMGTIGAIEFRVTNEIVNGKADFIKVSNSVINEKLECAICKIEFKCKGSLTKHLKKVHSDSVNKTIPMNNHPILTDSSKIS